MDDIHHAAERRHGATLTEVVDDKCFLCSSWILWAPFRHQTGWHWRWPRGWVEEWCKYQLLQLATSHDEDDTEPRSKDFILQKPDYAKTTSEERHLPRMKSRHWLDLSGMHPYANDTCCLVRCPTQQDFNELRAAQRGMFRKREEIAGSSPSAGAPLHSHPVGPAFIRGEEMPCRQVACCSLSHRSGQRAGCPRALHCSWEKLNHPDHTALLPLFRRTFLFDFTSLLFALPLSLGLHWNQVPTVPGAAQAHGQRQPLPHGVCSRTRLDSLN